MDGTALRRQNLCAIGNQMLRDRDMICFEITTQIRAINLN
jgi:hypothetical protein